MISAIMKTTVCKCLHVKHKKFWIIHSILKLTNNETTLSAKTKSIVCKCDPITCKKLNSHS